MGVTEKQTLRKFRRESKVMSICTFHFLNICMDSMTRVNATFPTIFFFLLKTSLFRIVGFFLRVFVPHTRLHSHRYCTGVDRKLFIVQ